VKQTIHLYASLKDIVGSSQITVELTEPATVETLVGVLLSKYPALEPVSRNILISVDQNFADRSQKLSKEDEIAMFPPVSGG
jgi:MoaE-MoaD fusion protein